MNRLADYFVTYDYRRERWQVKPMGWVALFLTLILVMGVGLGVWRGLTGQVTPASASVAAGRPAVAAGRPAVAAASGGPSTPSASDRPLNWPVWQEQDEYGHLVYQVPPEVRQMILDDFTQAMSWWESNLLKPDELARHLSAYFTDRELTRRQGSVAAIRQFGMVGIVYEEAPLPEGYPTGVRVESLAPNGREAYVAQYVGRRQAAFYRVDDGGLIEGSQETLPAMAFSYRLVFDETARRWLIAEQILVYDLDNDFPLKGDMQR